MTARPRVLHLCCGLEVGGQERAVVRLARRGRGDGQDHRILLFDTPPGRRSLDPAGTPVGFLRRGPGFDIRFPWLLSRLLRRERVDVLHAHNDTAIFYGAIACRLARRSRLVGTFHSFPEHGGAAARLATRHAAAQADAVVAVADELGERLVRTGWIRGCATIWNGVDLTEFRPVGPAPDWRGRLGIPVDHVVFAMVARLQPIKRHADLVEALRLLGPDLPVTVVFVGDGPERSRVREWACVPNVHWIANLEDVAGLLRCVDGFVLCSDHEGAPLALLEAMACGRAVIATGVGGIPAIVGTRHSSAALLVPPRRPDLLAGAMRRLALDHALRTALGREAAERARAFTFEAEWRGYAEIYRSPAPR